MVKTAVALCEGKLIGIETIYTVINGKQINEPEKLEELREKSGANMLFCPCGCGTNLILVAGDRNIRAQHFRLKDSKAENHLVTEGRCSVESKIALKCWLDEKLGVNDIESRVQISSFEDTSRKYEFTFLSKSKQIALNYSYDRSNLSDEKFDILESNSKGIKIIYIVDESNSDTDGQYPEWMMKVQRRQGYCLFLHNENRDYYKATMKAVFYAKGIDSLWKKISFAEGMIDEFDIADGGILLFKGIRIDELFTQAKSIFDNELKEAIKQKEKAELERKEYLDKLRKEQIEKRIEEQKRMEELAQKRKIKEEKDREERKKAEEYLAKRMAEEVTCKYCGKVAGINEFATYGGNPEEAKLGLCRECARNNPNAKLKIEPKRTARNIYNYMFCPDCGGKLVERNGKNGKFLGCSNFPKCRHTRNI